MPDNASTVCGVKQAPSAGKWLKCGQVGSYKELNKFKAKPKFERDHVPSHAAMLKAAKASNPGMLANKLACVKQKLKDQALTIAIPKGVHRKTSRTCGSRNTKAQIKADSKDLDGAANKDLATIQKKVNGTACEDAYRAAAKQVREQDHKALIKKVVAECP